MPLAHPFYFFVAKRDANRDLRPFQCRDAVACWQLVEALRPLGFELGEEFINNPPPAEWPEDPTRLVRVDTSACDPRDRIATSTRWPVSDDEQGCRKRVERAYTDLEQEILDVWRAYLPVLSRDHVRLHPDFHSRLPAGYENRYDMRFYQEHCARYMELRAFAERGHRRFAGNEQRTAAFLLHLPRLPQRNVGYVGAWSLDGTSTLVWTRLLRHRHGDLLRESGFVMAELIGAPVPDRPTDYRWTLDWRAEILLHVPLVPGGRERRRAPAPPRPRSQAA